MSRMRIDKNPLNITALSRDMAASCAGAFVSFEGWVRNANDGLPVTALEYEVFHPLAVSEGEAVLQEAIEKFGLSGAAAVHREGRLEIGDCAIWIGVTAPHRSAAFDGCRYIIDEIKHRLPVWKKEHYAGSDAVWVNCQHKDHHSTKPATAPAQFYGRQMLLPDIGADGQKKIGAAKILIVGVGGLGCAAATALASAGVGAIGLADADIVQVSNLHRQPLYTVADIGKPKVGAAALKIKAMNPWADIITHVEKLTARNADGICENYDVILDCTDNFTAKYLLNDMSVKLNKILVQASLYRFEGQLLTIDPANDHGCLRCLWPMPPQPGMIADCADAGVLGTLPMIFGAMQANEAIKQIVGMGVSGNLLTFDLRGLQSQSIARAKNAACPACGALRLAMPVPDKNLDIELVEGDTLESLADRYMLIDVRERSEAEFAPLPGSTSMLFKSFAENEVTFEKDAPILVVCSHGMRSAVIARKLRQAGWINACSLAGGAEPLFQSNLRRRA